MTVEQLARELGLEEILAAADAEDDVLERDVTHEDFYAGRGVPMVRGELVA